MRVCQLMRSTWSQHQQRSATTAAAAAAAARVQITVKIIKRQFLLYHRHQTLYSKSPDSIFQLSRWPLVVVKSGFSCC